MAAYDGIVVDLLTAQLDYWTVRERVAGKRDAERRTLRELLPFLQD